MATNEAKSQTTTTSRRSRRSAAANGRATAALDGATGDGDTAKGRAAANGQDTAKSTTGKPATGTRTRRKTAAAAAMGTTARARIDRPEPKTTGGPETNGASTTATTPPGPRPAERVLDLSRLAGFRTQLNQMEAQQRERLTKVAQLTVIAIIFITFVLQNSAGVNVHFLLFSVNIRLIWVIFGCGLLGGVGGYLIGRPDKSLKAMLPEKVRARAWGRFPRKAA